MEVPTRFAALCTGLAFAIASAGCSEGAAPSDTGHGQSAGDGSVAMAGAAGLGAGATSGAETSSGASSTAGNSGSASSGASGGGADSVGSAGAGAGGSAGAADGATAGAASGAFAHPGILHTQPELDRMIAKVGAGAEPWTSGFEKLATSSFAQSGYTANPQQVVCAGGGGCPNGETFLPLARDCAAAYQNALLYRISGDVKHAEKAVQILNAWSSTLMKITGDSNAGLRAGLYGYQLAAAAELIRDYPGWARADFERLKNLLLTKFYPINSDFLKRHNNTCFDHYYANWDLANMTTILSIGILTDDREKFDEAIDYFKSGTGTGSDMIFAEVAHVLPSLDKVSSERCAHLRNGCGKISKHQLCAQAHHAEAKAAACDHDSASALRLRAW